MKIIFLDIDGVLNSHQYFQGKLRSIKPPRHFSCHIDKRNVVWLNRILKRTKAKIVIVSTWGSNFGVDFCKDCFAKVEIVGDVVDCITNDDGYREDYIKRYISSNLIESYIIIDDFKMDDEELFNHQIHTSNWNGGLKYEHVEKAINLLNKKENRK